MIILKGGEKIMGIKYKIIKSKTMGFALFEKCGGFWQQISKWYVYYGNLKRFCTKANEPSYYEIID